MLTNPPSPPKTRRNVTTTNPMNNSSTRVVQFDISSAIGDVSTLPNPPSASCAQLPNGHNIHDDEPLNHQQTHPNAPTGAVQNNNLVHHNGDGNNEPLPAASPDIVPFDDIPQQWVLMIKAAIHTLTGITTPHEYQIETIYHAITEIDTTMYLIRKTSAGKSLVPQTIAFIRGGISVNLVPLIGLGCHQVDKASSYAQHNVEAYHVDEHHGDDDKLLRKRLNCMSKEEAKEIAIMLYVSPQKMKANSDWVHQLENLAEKGLISMFCIDEAHYVEQAGRSFRTEFVEAVESIAMLIRKMPSPVPCIAMSATFTERDRNRVTELLRDRTPVISAGGLGRRSTTFTCHVSGRPSTSLKSSAVQHLQQRPMVQQIFYTNSCRNAEGPLLDIAQNMLDTNQNHGVPTWSIAGSFTGEDGLMLKTGKMGAFSNYNIAGNESVNDSLPMYQIMVCTGAAEAGISSDSVYHVKQTGLPASFHVISQNLGRVNRQQMVADPNTFTYEVHLSFDSLISLIVRTMRNDDTSERTKQLSEMKSVLKLLLTPSECYHSALERHFEVHEDRNKGPCEAYCTYCRDDGMKHFTHPFHVRKLKSFLTKNIQQQPTTAMTPSKFIQSLKKEACNIFHKDDIPVREMGPIHGLALQLYAKDIIGIQVGDTAKVGTPRFNRNHLRVTLPAMDFGDEVGLMPVYTVLESYHVFGANADASLSHDWQKQNQNWQNCRPSIT
eukprot:scaffold3571_cov78-Skeletonema_dohrnii-CCMP3373.AAC.2